MLLVAIYEAVLVGVRRSPLIMYGLYKFFTPLLRFIFTVDSPVNRQYYFDLDKNPICNL